MIKKKSLIKTILFWGIIFIIVIGAGFIVFDIISSNIYFNSQAKKMRTDYLSVTKEKIKREVEQVVYLIKDKKSKTEKLIKEKLHTRVYHAYSIAQNIYTKNKHNKTKNQIQKMIIEALSPIRYSKERGYFVIFDLDGVPKLFPSMPELEGTNMMGFQDTDKRYLTKEMIKIVEGPGEGFYNYKWIKSGGNNIKLKKIAFIKKFKPYNWFIATGLFVQDVENQIKTDLLSTISKIRFGKEGYVFVNELNGNALVANGKVISSEKKLWEVFSKNPEKTKALFEMEYNAAKKLEGDYIYYSLIKLTRPDEESPKVSFIYGIPELKWLVGAGVYLNDVDDDIALMHAALNDQVKMKSIYFILIIAGIILLFLFFLSLLTNKIKNDYKLFLSFFNKTVHSNEEINRDLIQFLELDRMAEYANRMRKELISSKENYKDLFNDNPVALWEEDFSEVKNKLDDVKTKGAVITKEYFNDNIDLFNECRSVIKISNINKATLELLKFKNLKDLEKNNSSILNEKTLETIKNEFIAIANDKKYFSEESELVRSDGEVLDVIVHFQVIDTYKRILFSITDISDLKKTENALVKSERYFRILMEQSPVSIMIFNKEGFLMNANQAWMDLWNIEDISNVLGKFNILKDKQLLEKRDVDKFKKVFAGEKIYIPESEFNPTFSDYSGRKRVVKIIAYPLKDTDGMFENIVVLQEDITDQKNMEEELNKIQMLKSVGTLAGGIAHDFNNILMGLFGNISLAKMKLSKDRSSLKYLEDAENSLNWATSLTKQLLTFSKGGSPIKETISLEQLIEDVVKFDLSGSNVKPLIKIAEDLWLAEVDKGQIQQMFSNLTINANQAMPDGGHLYIKLENAEISDNLIPGLSVGQYIRVTMRDEGTGIDKKHIGRIYDPYFSTKQSGSGLGLATVYSIVNKHEGHISINSELGDGTEFIVYLPASKNQQVSIKEDLVPQIAIVENKGTVLVMDDDDIVCNVASQMLESLGFSAEIAKDGSTALEMYKIAMENRKPYDVIIMDLTIPGGVGGKEVIKQLLLVDPDVKAIVSSGYADDPVMANFSEYGFMGILAKPYMINLLANVLNTVLNEKH